MKVAAFLAALVAGVSATPIVSITSPENPVPNEHLFGLDGAHAVQAHERYAVERLKVQQKQKRNEATRPIVPFTPAPEPVPQVPDFPTHHERPTKVAAPSIPGFPAHHDKQQQQQTEATVTAAPILPVALNGGPDPVILAAERAASASMKAEDEKKAKKGKKARPTKTKAATAN